MQIVEEFITRMSFEKSVSMVQLNQFVHEIKIHK